MGQKVIVIALGVVFVLLAVNIGTNFYFYKQYKENINYFDQQNWLTRVKIENMEKTVDGYKNTVDSLNSQFNNYAENLTLIEKKVGSNEKDLVSKINDMQEWQKQYTNVLAEIKERTEILKINMEHLAKGVTGEVDLGKISVKNEPKATAEAYTPPSTKRSSNISTKKTATEESTVSVNRGNFISPKKRSSM